MDKKVAEKLIIDLDQKKAKRKWDIFRKSTSDPNKSKSKPKFDDKVPLLKDKTFLKVVQETPQSSFNSTLDSQSAAIKPLQTVEEAEITKVIDIMQENLDKAKNLNTQLREIDSKAGQLYAGVQEFHGTAEKIQRKYWWHNFKGMLIYYIVFGLILVAIFGGIVGKMLSSSNQHTAREAFEKSGVRLNQKRMFNNPSVSKFLSED